MSVFAIILGLMPGFAWLLFYDEEEGTGHEPRSLIALTFVNGAIFAFVALGIQMGLEYAFQAWGGTFSSSRVFIFAAIEETVKFAAAYMAVSRNPYFDEPIEAMFYSIVAALGFATMENIGVLWGIPQESVFMPQILQLITFRFLGATLLHTLSSAIAGYYWALSIRRFNSVITLLVGLGLATALHGTFNLFVLSFGEKGFSLILLFVAAFFVLADFEKLRTKVI